MTERMTDERFDQLCNFASHPGIKPWITELATELAVYRAENATLRAKIKELEVITDDLELKDPGLVGFKRNWVRRAESERDQLRAYVAELESENTKFKTFVSALKKLRRQRVEGPSFIPGVIERSPLYMLFWSDVEPLIAKLERHPADTNRVRAREDQNHD